MHCLTYICCKVCSFRPAAIMQGKQPQQQDQRQADAMMYMTNANCHQSTGRRASYGPGYA